MDFSQSPRWLLRCPAEMKPAALGSKCCGGHQVIPAMIRVVHESTEVFQITLFAQALACLPPCISKDVLSNQILFILPRTRVHQPSVSRYAGTFKVTCACSVERQSNKLANVRFGRHFCTPQNAAFDVCQSLLLSGYLCCAGFSHLLQRQASKSSVPSIWYRVATLQHVITPASRLFGLVKARPSKRPTKLQLGCLPQRPICFIQLITTHMFDQGSPNFCAQFSR